MNITINENKINLLNKISIVLALILITAGIAEAIMASLWGLTLVLFGITLLCSCIITIVKSSYDRTFCVIQEVLPPPIINKEG